MALDILDIALRGASTGGCITLMLLLWMSRISRDAQLAFSLLSLTIFGRLWSTLPPGIEISESVLLTNRYIGCGGTLAITWFLVTIFLDDKRFAWGWLLSGAFISASIPLTPYWEPSALMLRSYAFVHFSSLLALVLYTGRDDLQDARRRLRPGMSTFLLLYCIALTIGSSPMHATETIGAALFHSSTSFVFVTLFMVWALKADLNNWPGRVMPRSNQVPTPAQRSSEQSVLIGRIQAAMDKGIWQVEGLTVGALAADVGAPEHQVRKAINQVLGHRNFASFINRARIDAAMARLSAPEATETTILEIAYDVGFSSLGPFNRAFRETTGQSPTDFRRQVLQQGTA